MLKFTKMHGLGNDFMVIDGVTQVFEPNKEQIKAWSDRHTGIGFDQLLLVEKAHSPQADFRYRIFNADGGEVEQCGNGARCFAYFVVYKGLSNKKEMVVETIKGNIILHLHEDNTVTVDMGQPKFEAAEIPFLLNSVQEEQNLTHFIVDGTLTIPLSCVNIGNPHAVVLVEDLEHIPIQDWGLVVESHPRFPEKVNAGFMQVISRNHIQLRVYERGTGETLACGSGACAAVVVGIRLGLLDEKVLVSQRGGDVWINWQEQGHVLMTGPAVIVFEGELD